MLRGMRRFALAGLLGGAAVAGCDSPGRSGVDASIGIGDAEPDAQRPRNDPGPAPFRQPYDARFLTPAGTFEAHYLYAQAVWGDCNPPYWELVFATVESGSGPSVKLGITMPPYAGSEVTGTMPAAYAQYESPQPLVIQLTRNAAFEATRIDYSGDGAARITGHFLVTDPAWTIDLNLDVLGGSGGCI
jgi:hypothetical protein